MIAIVMLWDRQVRSFVGREWIAWIGAALFIALGIYAYFWNPSPHRWIWPLLGVLMGCNYVAIAAAARRRRTRQTVTDP